MGWYWWWVVSSFQLQLLMGGLRDTVGLPCMFHVIRYKMSDDVIYECYPYSASPAVGSCMNQDQPYPPLEMAQGWMSE